MANKTYDANSISVLEGLEAVRKRPGMYIGSVSTKGLNHLIYEIVDNSVDEFLAGYCDEITVSLNKDGTATITDNGRGIPVGINERTGKTAVEMVFTMLHAGGKFGDGGYKISGGLHGVGASVVNALSTWLTVTVKQGGKIYQQRYERGKIITPLEVIGTCRKSDTGTNVQFLPDPEIFDKTYFKAAMVRNRLHETAYLNPKLTINGVVFTMYDGRTNLSMQVIENVRNNLNQTIYDTIIPRGVRLAEAPSHGLPITQYDNRSTGAKAYMALAKEVIERSAK